MVSLRQVRCPSVTAITVLFPCLPILAGCGGESQPEPVVRPVRTLQVFVSGGTRRRSFSGMFAQNHWDHDLERFPGLVQTPNR